MEWKTVHGAWQYIIFCGGQNVANQQKLCGQWINSESIVGVSGIRTKRLIRR